MTNKLACFGECRKKIGAFLNEKAYRDFFVGETEKVISDRKEILISCLSLSLCHTQTHTLCHSVSVSLSLSLLVVKKYDEIVRVREEKGSNEKMCERERVRERERKIKIRREREDKKGFKKRMRKNEK